MNSPRRDDLADTLFRQALRPDAAARPPAHAWEHIADAVQRAQGERVDAAGIGQVWLPGLVAFARRLLHYRPRPASLLHGAIEAYPPSSRDIRCIGPDGTCRPSPFGGVFATQMLGLRLAS